MRLPCLQSCKHDSIIAPSKLMICDMTARLRRTLLLIGVAIVTLTACTYRMDIPQGNRIDPELVEQLEIGMSRNQVEFLLGTPAIVDPFHPDQWHYVYFFKRGKDGKIEQRSMTLTFTGDLLSSIDGTLNPG